MMSRDNTGPRLSNNFWDDVCIPVFVTYQNMSCSDMPVSAKSRNQAHPKSPRSTIDAGATANKATKVLRVTTLSNNPQAPRASLEHLPNAKY
jgi:hypothetical protein